MRKVLLFLSVTIVVVLMVTVFSITGCKTATAETTAAGETTIAETTAAETTVAKKLGGSIRLLCWEGYEFPETFPKWAEENGVTIDPTFIASNEEIFSKLKAGDQYDIVTPIQAYIKPLMDNKLIQAIDTSKISNWNTIFPEILDAIPNKYDGKIWSTPMCWGANSWVYDADATGPLESWTDLTKPEYKGKFVLLDDVIGQITMGARVVGITGDPSLITPDQLEQIKQWLIEVKRNSKSVVLSFGEAKTMMESGEVFAWANGNVMIAVEGVKDGYNFKGMQIPKEGTLTFIDSYCIPTTSQNPDGALALCNAVLDAQTQLLGSIRYLASGSTVNTVLPLMTAEDKALGYPYEDLGKFWATNVLGGPVPAEHGQYTTMEDWNKVWEEVKASK